MRLGLFSAMRHPVKLQIAFLSLAYEVANRHVCIFLLFKNINNNSSDVAGERMHPHWIVLMVYTYAAI